MGGIVGGIILAVVGAILSFGVKDSISGVDLETIGLIVMIGGVVIAVIGLIYTFTRRSSVTTNRAVDSSGREAVTESKTSSSL